MYQSLFLFFIVVSLICCRFIICESENNGVHQKYNNNNDTSNNDNSNNNNIKKSNSNKLKKIRSKEFPLSIRKKNDFISYSNSSHSHHHNSITATKIKGKEFQFGSIRPYIAVYRLIGNDMPPLQSTGQLLLNTKFALQHESHFEGGIKKWILNRIWNETNFKIIYKTLIDNGVSRKDIIVRCFDITEYNKMDNFQEKMVYLTSQNEARNDGIADGKNNNYDWSIILDGNTFVTSDSWQRIKNALKRADKNKIRLIIIKIMTITTIIIIPQDCIQVIIITKPITL